MADPEDLKVRSLTVVDAEGGSVATLTAASGGGGLWITGPAGNVVALFSIERQTGIGIYSKKSLTDGHGMPLCLFVGDGGEVGLQVRDGDEMFFLSARDLRALNRAGVRPGALPTVPVPDQLKGN